MAGEWIKFELGTPEKPEVFGITAAMGWDDPDLTVGKLLKVWRWFDQQTVDGDAPSVTLALLDRIAGVTGFAQAMASVGWLEHYDGGLRLPRFATHNGQTAKRRAQTAMRNAALRARSAGHDAARDAASVTPASRKQDKSREDKTTPVFNARRALAELGVTEQVASDWLDLRGRKRAPVTRTVLEGIAKEAAKASMTLTQALALACSRGWTGFEAEWVVRRAGDSARQFGDALTGRSGGDDPTIIDLN